MYSLSADVKIVAPNNSFKLEPIDAAARDSGDRGDGSHDDDLQ